MIRTKRDARALIGTHDVSAASGQTRYLALQEDGADVVGLLYGNEIIRWRESTVQLWTRGYPSPSTFDALAWALDVGRGGKSCGTVHRVPYVLGHVLREGIMFDVENGAVVREGGELHLAPGRSLSLHVNDVSLDEGGGERVHVVDWSYDGRDHGAQARRLAAAYVGRPCARTRVLHGTPDLPEPCWLVQVLP